MRIRSEPGQPGATRCWSCVSKAPGSRSNPAIECSYVSHAGEIRLSPLELPSPPHGSATSVVKALPDVFGAGGSVPPVQIVTTLPGNLTADAAIHA